MQELSWTCYTYLGWRNNRADKKAVACLFACRSFNTVITAFVSVINRHHTQRQVSFLLWRLRQARICLGSSLYFFFFLLLLQLKLFHHQAINTSRGKGGDEKAVSRHRGCNSAFGHQSRVHMHFLHRVDRLLHRAGTTAMLRKEAPDALLQVRPHLPPLILEWGITVASRN